MRGSARLSKHGTRLAGRAIEVVAACWPCKHRLAERTGSFLQKLGSAFHGRPTSRNHACVCAHAPNSQRKPVRRRARLCFPQAIFPTFPKNSSFDTIERSHKTQSNGGIRTSSRAQRTQPVYSPDGAHVPSRSPAARWPTKGVRNQGDGGSYLYFAQLPSLAGSCGCSAAAAANARRACEATWRPWADALHSCLPFQQATAAGEPM